MSVLSGIRVVEFGGIGPGPYCCMLLADMGAEVVRVERTTVVGCDSVAPHFNTMLRGQRSVALDLKHPGGRDAALRLCDGADIVIEGFRPGVMESLGLGPEVVLARHPAVVYGRMTGWGQTGPLADTPGHDINYIALTGALHAIGTAAQGPVPPLILAGDFGGGGAYLAIGVLAAYIEATRTGQGQIVDAAIVDGAAASMTAFYGMLAAGSVVEQRESNPLDGGSHFYNTYETRDGGYISIAAIEPKFYARLLQLLGLSAADYAQNDRVHWQEHRITFANIFKQKTRAEWTGLLQQEALCFAPVLSMSEAPSHPHLAARNSFVNIGGVVQPAPAPRFSRTASQVKSAPAFAGQHTVAELADCGLGQSTIDSLLKSGAARQREE